MAVVEYCIKNFIFAHFFCILYSNVILAYTQTFFIKILLRDELYGMGASVAATRIDV